ncbi:MAG: hypothetical protein A4E53_01266 [Pelotomaculum sp. PtaB.Bin104]|nr:MAG: hypothetical protein A4E53_01266 [Pelotomaculum sp. PtaB.Bin104]
MTKCPFTKRNNLKKDKAMNEISSELTCENSIFNKGNPNDHKNIVKNSLQP